MPTQTVMISMLGEIDNDFQRPVDNHGNRVTSSHLFRGEVPQQEMPDRVESSTQDMNPSDRSPPRSACSRNASALIPCDFLCNSKDDSEGHGNRKHGVLSDESVGAKEKLDIDSPAAASELPTPPVSHLNNGCSNSNAMNESPCDVRNDDQHETSQSSNSDGQLTTKGKRKHTLSPESVEWILSPDHIDHPYPNDGEKQKIMADIGLGLNQVNMSDFLKRNAKKALRIKTSASDGILHQEIEEVAAVNCADETLQTPCTPPKLLATCLNKVSNEEKVEVEGIEYHHEIPFPITLHTIVSDRSCDRSIHWLPCGTKFMIPDKKFFADNVLPTYFADRKSTKLSSFLRRLRRWLFERVRSGPETGAFYHPQFLKDQPNLVRNIKYPDKHHTQAKKVPRTEIRTQSQKCIDGKLNQQKSTSTGSGREHLNKLITYQGCGEDFKGTKKPHVDQGQFIPPPSFERNYTPPGIRREHIDKHMKNQGCGDGFKGIKKPYGDQGQFMPPPSFVSTSFPEGYSSFLASKANCQVTDEYPMHFTLLMHPPAPEFVPWQNASAGSGFATWKNAPLGACPKFILTSSGGAPVSGDAAYFKERAGYSRIQEMHVDYPQPTDLLSAKHVFASSSRTDELTKAEIMIRKSISPDECTSSRHRKK